MGKKKKKKKKRAHNYLADREETSQEKRPASAGVNIYICFICLFRTIKYRPLSTHSNTRMSWCCLQKYQEERHIQTSFIKKYTYWALFYIWALRGRHELHFSNKRSFLQEKTEQLSCRKAYSRVNIHTHQ